MSLNYPCCLADPASTRHEEVIRLCNQAYKLYVPDCEKGKKAMAIVDKALQLEPNACFPHSLKADFIFQTEDDDAGALAQINQAVAAEPDNPDSLRLKAKILRRLNRLPEALQSINKANLNSSKPKASNFQVKSDILHDMGDNKGAEEAITQSINIEPTCFDFRMDRAKLREQLKNYTGEIEDTSVIIKDQFRAKSVIQVVHAYRMRALAYARTKKNDLAKQDYLYIYNKAPDVRPVMMEAKQFFESIGDKKNLELILQRLKRMDSDYKL